MNLRVILLMFSWFSKIINNEIMLFETCSYCADISSLQLTTFFSKASLKIIMKWFVKLNLWKIAPKIIKDHSRTYFCLQEVLTIDPWKSTVFLPLVFLEKEHFTMRKTNSWSLYLWKFKQNVSIFFIFSKWFLKFIVRKVTDFFLLYIYDYTLLVLKSFALFWN